MFLILIVFLPYYLGDKIEKEKRLYYFFIKISKMGHYDKESVRTILWKTLETSDLFEKDSIRIDSYGNIVVNFYQVRYMTKERSKILASLDHIIPSSKGGKNTIFNLQIIPKFVNLLKGNKVGFEKEISVMKQGVNEFQLYKELQKDIHSVCKKYNFLFVKNPNGKYKITKVFYNDEYLY